MAPYFYCVHSAVCFLSFVLLPNLVVSQVLQNNPSCPTFGSESNNSTYQQGERAPSGLVLNFGNPAQCNGTVTEWSYCFQTPKNSRGNYSATFMVYRKFSESGYTVVPNSNHTIRLFIDISQPFICNTSNAKEFVVQENDIIGACFSNDGEEPLNIISEVRRNVEFNVYKSSNCPDDANDLDREKHYILHLQAHISASQFNECGTVGNNPQPTSFTEETGTLLNTQHPSACSGEVTSLQLCYYTSDTAIEGGRQSKIYNLTVGIWRPSGANGTYTSVEGNFRNISLELRRSKLQPPLVCVTKPVVPFSIQSGDVLGVVIPTKRPIPIVASGKNGTWLREWISNQSFNLSLHLHAMVVNKRTQRSSGVAAAIVVVLLVAIAIAVSVVLLVLFYWRKQGRNLVVRGILPRHDYKRTQRGSTVPLHREPSRHSSKKPTHYKPTRETSKTVEREEGDDNSSAAQPTRTLPQSILNEPPRLVVKTSPKPIQRRPVSKPPSIKKVAMLPVERVSERSVAEQGTRYETSSGNYSMSTGYEVDYAVLLEKNMQEDIYSSVDDYTNPASDKDSLYAQLLGWGITHIKRELIRSVSHLGSGQFGTVELGKWDDESRKVDVALKTLNKGSSLQNTIMFLQEAAIMAQFRHPNVIKLHGVVISGEPIVLVVELADRDLLEQLDYIKGSRLKVTEVRKLLLKYCQQVGLGMQYLSAKGFVHRDLAARNILIKKDIICKIADFGMSRDLAQEEIYVSSGGKIPLKWTAPEAFRYRKYSTASDVWSYGCVIYEIWSLGMKPFGSEMNNQVVKLLKSGFRLPPPPGCSRVVYETMIDTWHPNPDQRPTFRDIVLKFSRNQRQILEITEQDLRTHSEAGRVGAELEAGLLMYEDLQQKYRGT